jgi:cytidylate kinase
MLASRLGYRFIDTGIMYRALTWAVIRDGIDTDNEAAVTALAQHTKIYISGNDGKEDQLISVDDQDVTKMLRTSEIERGVSQISRFTGVRQAMVALQRILAKDGMLIMAGRDIGTVVLPDADLKIFLTASSEERARRRHNDMKDASQAPALEQVMDELLNRDKLDTERTNSPLRPADGAHILNTESIDLAQVVEQIMTLTEDD